MDYISHTYAEMRTSVRLLSKLCVDSFFVVHQNQTIESGDSKDALIRGYWFFEEINKRFFSYPTSAKNRYRII